MRLDFGAARRFDDVDSLDPGKRTFEHLGDLAFHEDRRSAGIAGRNRNDRLVDLGIFAHRQPVIGDRPISRRMRLRTVAKTGRRMQSSERDMAHASSRSPPAGDMDDLDVCAVMQALLAGDHDLLAGRDTFDDFDEATFAPTGADLDLERLAVVGLVDQEIIAARHESAFGHGHGIARCALDGDAGEQARPQMAVAIVEHGAHLDGAPVDVDRGIDGVDLALELHSRQSVGGDSISWPTVTRSRINLGNAEGHFELIDLLEIDKRRAGGDIGAGRNHAEAENAGKGRLDRQLIMLGLGKVRGRPGRPPVRSSPYRGVLCVALPDLRSVSADRSWPGRA